MNKSEQFENDEYSDDVKVVGEENLEDDTELNGYEIREPEPEQAAQVSSNEGKSRNYLFLFAYLIGLFVVAVVVVFAFVYWRGGGNTQNANIKVEKKQNPNSSTSAETSDPTYEEAANIVKPTTMPQPNGTPLPVQDQSAPQTNTGGNILAQPTTGYTLGGNSDFIYPKPQPSPEQVKNGNSSNGGGGNFKVAKSDSVGSSDEVKPLLPKVVSDELETKSLTRNAVFTPSSNSANRTSIYYYSSVASNNQEKEMTSKFEKSNVPVKLPFGTVLPVRLMGALHSLSRGGYARMELTRAVSNGEYFLPRGTQFIGRLQGGAADRIFIEMIGYLDRRGNLVKLSGDVLNTDGSIGIKGKREKLGSKWKRYLAPVAEVARQFGLAYLQSRTNSSVTVLPQDSTLPVIGEVNNNRRSDSEFVSVSAGQFAYIFINDLPSADGNGQGFSDSTETFSTINEIKAITSDSVDADKTLQNLSPELRKQIAAKQ